jgi:uncharacterized membrane protein
MKSKMNISIIFQVATILTTGLLAGLFYGYCCSVNKGLGNLSDEKYLEAFQSINTAIQNPIFFLSFIGSAFLLLISSYINYQSGISTTFYFSISATFIYFIGVLGITFFYNIPLNEKLNNFNIATATLSEITIMRKIFEKPWNIYHTVRTVASIITFGLSIFSLVKQKV